MLALLASAGGLAVAGVPLALAGGPVGVVIAWLGARFGTGSAKVIAILVGLAVLVIATAAVTVHLQHLKRDADLYVAIAARDASLEARLGCPHRPAHERDLAACMTAVERDAAEAKRIEIEQQRREAALAQAAADLAALVARKSQDDEDAAIETDAAGDGSVPAVLLHSWARARAARGVK